MAWRKLGQIYKVNNNNSFLISHASNPLPLQLEDNVYRIYYSGRSVDNRSSVAYVDYDINKQKIIYDPKKPILQFGKEDSFYSHGISIGNIIEHEKSKFVGFMGWQVKNGEHWRGDIGKFNLDTGKVTKLLGISEEDKISLSYPFIISEDNIYKMWYGSTISWTSNNGEMIHVIKYATSKNFIDWDLHGVAIPYELGKAQAFSRPTIIKIENKYHMWFSFRSGDGTPYRIGHCFSKDGMKWEYADNDIHVSESGWDSQMICYPYVFSNKNKIYMLYNGNNYGKEGFGLAILE